jgi:hypothetical protein
VYSTLQPELVKEQAQREEVDPAFVSQHPKEHLKHEQQAAEAQRDTAISRAMARRTPWQQMPLAVPKAKTKYVPAAATH